MVNRICGQAALLMCVLLGRRMNPRYLSREKKINKYIVERENEGRWAFKRLFASGCQGKHLIFINLSIIEAAVGLG